MPTLLQQAKYKIRQRILCGVYPQEQVLPLVEQLAAQLQYSSATVERALNELAAEGVVKRVRRKGTIVQKLNGAPLGRVCLLQTNDSHTNQLLVDPVFQCFRDAGFAVDLVPFIGELDVVCQHCENVRQQPQNCGILVCLWAPSKPNAVFDRLLSHFDRVILFQDHPEPASIPLAKWVTLDLQQMGRDVMQYLLQLGHRRIAVAAGMNPAEYSFVHDLADFCRHLVEVQGGTVVPYLFSDEGRELLVEKVCSRQITALWTVTDYEALLVMNMLHRAGLSIPEDISIVGRNNTPWCNETTPALTSTSWNPPMVAQAIVDTATALLKGRADVPVVTRIKPELMVRESCAPPR